MSWYDYSDDEWHYYDSSDDEWYQYSSDDEKECGLSVEKLNLGPRKKLLVLNLGGLLCHRIRRRERPSDHRFRKPDGGYGGFYVYERPHYEDFLKFCLENFEVGIWSSSKEYHLTNTLDCIMERSLKSKLLFVWGQEKCTDSGFMALENKEKPIFLKELKKLENPRIQYSESKTLLIDANPYKALLNPPHTAIFPNEYKAEQAGDAALGPGGDLRLYLEGLVDADDVPSYVKDHPFGQPAITPAHSEWEFYSNIISRFQKE